MKLVSGTISITLSARYPESIPSAITSYAQSLIDDFSDPKKFPQIAISVDMLDTGLDVPEILKIHTPFSSKQICVISQLNNYCSLHRQIVF